MYNKKKQVIFYPFYIIKMNEVIVMSFTDRTLLSFDFSIYFQL
jgi:hypothetical protein